MARKKKHPEHVNHERWLVSYADFITLLFAFFVVMFAVSQVDSKKMGRFSESFAKAVGVELMPGGQTMLPSEPADLPSQKPQGNGQGSLTPELKNILAELKVRSRRDGNMEKLQVVERQNELVIRMPDNLVFDSGDDRIKEPARVLIASIAKALAGRKVNLRVEGHTDNRPISTPRFRSNWELSTARATSVIAELAKAELDPKSLSAAGYGEFHPVASNDTPAGRAQNRRVDLVITTAAPENFDGMTRSLGATDEDAGVADGGGGDLDAGVLEGGSEDAGTEPHDANGASAGHEPKDEKHEPEPKDQKHEPEPKGGKE
jgi:chemotaxis protein MotB